MMRWIIKSSLIFRYLIVAIAAALIFFGVKQLRTMPVDAFPDFAPPLVEIQTEAPGMSAAEVESLVTIQLEDMLSSTPNLDVMRSKSVPELSSIQLLFKPGADEMMARQLVSERLGVAIRDLPSLAGIPSMLPPLSATSRMMHIGVTSQTYSLMDLSMISYWTIRWRLMAVPGVANVIIWGNRFKQMQLQVDPKRLQDAHVSIDSIQEVMSNALDFGFLKYTNGAKAQAGGFLDTPNQRLDIQHLLPVIEPKDLANIPVDNKTKADGSPIVLGDLGQVVWDTTPLIGDAVINGERGLLIIVEKFPWANTLEVTRNVDAALAEMRPGLPGITIDPMLFRSASFIEIAIDNLTVSLFISCLFVMFVLAAFLFEWRTTLISLIAIPLSLVVAGLVLSQFGVTVNTMILAGLVIAIGGVVDDAIIDVENILRRLRQARMENSNRSTASIILHASLEVRGSIIYAVLIDIAVLLPVFFLTGVSGAFFKPLAVAYALALLASMVVALTVTPALCLLLLNKKSLTQQSPLMLWLQRRYDGAHKWVMHKPLPMFVTITVLIMMCLLVVPFFGASLFPSFKERYFLNHWVTEPGTSDAEVVRITKRLSHDLLAIPGVTVFGSHIGRAPQGEEISGINFAENWLHIDESVDYDATLDKINHAINNYPGLFHDVQTYLNERIDETVAGITNPIAVRIYGPDLGVLRELGNTVLRSLSKVEGAVDVHTSLQVDVPHIQIKVDLAKAGRYHLKPGDVLRSAAAIISGLEVSDIYKDGKVYGVAIWGQPSTRHSLDSVRNLPIDTSDGNTVALKDIASVNIMPTPNLIEREVGSRYIDVSFDIARHNLGDIVGDVRERMKGITFPLGYHAEILGEYQERQAAQMLLLAIGIAAAVVVLLLLQAAFNSWRLALLAFITLPSALIGGVLALSAIGGVISLGSLVGFFTVFGIAARNGIMLINHCQHLEQHEGETFGPELVLRGAKERLAPIMMTALAAGLALVPLAISGNIPGQEIEYPMAIVILGGLTTSTLLNLFVMPYLYLCFGKSKKSPGH